MPSQSHEINSNQWTKVTTNQESGSYLSIGHASVFIYQGATPPTKPAGSAPIMDIVNRDSPTPFFDVPQGEFLWARTANGISYLHLTGGKTNASS